jgi:hypothetical protein
VQADGRAPVGKRLDRGDSPPAPGDDQPQLRIAVTVRLEQRLDLGLERCPLGIELDRGRRALQPVQVLGESQRPAAVEADDLEHAVAAVQAVVLQRDRRRRGRSDRSVD